MKKIATFLCLLFLASFAGCEQEPTAGDKIQDVGDAVGDAVKDVGDGIDDAADELDDGIE